MDVINEYRDIKARLMHSDFVVNLFGYYHCPEHGGFHVVWESDGKREPTAHCPICGKGV